MRSEFEGSPAGTLGQIIHEDTIIDNSQVSGTQSKEVAGQGDALLIQDHGELVTNLRDCNQDHPRPSQILFLFFSPP